MNIVNLFPTPVARFYFPRKLTGQELAFFTQQDCVANEGNTTSVNRNVVASAEIKDVAAWIQEKTNEYFQEVYKPKDDLQIYITQSWLNYTEQGEFHHRHHHPCSFVSGCFYVQTDDETDKIYFFSKQENEHSVFGFLPTEYTFLNATNWWLPVKTGELLLFPSSLTHMVAQKEAPGTRISLAYNTFLKGELGNPDGLSGLYL